MTEVSVSDRPLRVLMTADAVGGVWSYSVGLCRSLPEIQFVLATMGPRPVQVHRDALHGLENVTLAESNYSLEWMADGGLDFAESCGWLIHLAERFDPDVMHVNGYAHAPHVSDLPILVAAHSDVLSWWNAIHKAAAPPKWDGYRRRVINGLRAATHIAAPSAAALDDLERHYQPLTSPASVIPNGVDFAKFRPLDKRPIILAAGRVWDAAKNLTALNAAAPGLSWLVEIAGEVQNPDGGIASFTNVRLLGSLKPSEMARRLGHASIFVAPARYEPFGLAILEAAAAGCTLVLGDIPSLRENWEGAAAFIDPYCPADLQAAIATLIINPDRRNRLAAAARGRARHFTLDRMARAYSALYSDLMRDSARLGPAWCRS
jgi:glycosyltransferase involved in cell wall biosynthesis